MGLRRRALMAGSVVFDKSILSSAKLAGVSGGLGLFFFKMAFLTLFREVAIPCCQTGLGGSYTRVDRPEV
ncbi:hypothetical protein EMIT0P4_130113 [Pseudomonas sp. IT-P4]